MEAMNDYSSKLHETMWWMNNRTANSPQVHHSQPWPSHYQEEDEKHEEEEDEQEEEMIEYMFEKALTPSDVGKLNRLVIPKQHAEKYFPLSRLDSVEKGLLLSFEDESGKLWRFRYSYWNSSQSYVLTKGWSRYVKEKQLDAGDVVSFQRRRPDGQQLYIRWKRRAAAVAAAPPPPPPVHDSRLSHSSFLAHPTSTSSSSPGWSRVYYSAHPAYPSHQQHHSTHGPLHHAAVQPAAPAPVTPGRKQVRLFGVNLDCHLDEPEPPSPEASSLSSPDPTHFFYSHGHQQDFNYSQEYHNTRNYPGGGGGGGGGGDLSI